MNGLQIASAEAIPAAIQRYHGVQRDPLAVLSPVHGRFPQLNGRRR
ncbi:hypothetical protein KQ313_12975 [Synechococcus sp. CS-1325]|nr:hypothetical protein [Synechococcus sp. CS-1325]MCT0213526.1 hypothetical protein [Synechococcus sp. CS-1326]